MKKIKIIIMCILLMVLLVTPITSKKKTYQHFMEGKTYSFDPRIEEWYAIEDWELEVCRGKMHTKIPYDVDRGPTYLSQITITLQGEKTGGLPDEKILYEVAYYIEDALNRNLDFAVRLRTKEGKYKRVVAPTYLGENEAKSDYWADYLDEEYTDVQLGYELEDEDDEETIITVPIVNNSGEYYPSSDYGYSSGGDGGGGLRGGGW